LDFKKSKEKKLLVAKFVVIYSSSRCFIRTSPKYVCFLGLKAVFTELRLVGPGCCITNPLGKTVKFSTNDGKAMKFVEENLQQLL
jgi:hypothetical protein